MMVDSSKEKAPGILFSGAFAFILRPRGYDHGTVWNLSYLPTVTFSGSRSLNHSSSMGLNLPSFVHS